MSLPIHLRIAGRRVVVIGGGRIARRKIASLLAADARVVVIAPAIDSDIRRMLEASGEVLDRRYQSGDLAGAALVYAATDDAGVNAIVARDARALGILVNDTSDAQNSDFATPAVHRSGALTFAVDSHGAAPAFVLRVRDELAAQFDERYDRALRAAAGARAAADGAIVTLISRLDIDTLASAGSEEIAELAERAARGLRCATRASALATTQTALVTEHLARAGITSEIVQITTKGDQVQDRSIAAVGESVFVKELERALRDGRADYAVHSCKDLPSQIAPGMHIAAFTQREDPRDVFCSERYARFEDLPPGARVGTSSPRRCAFLRAKRSDLTFVDIRGNIDTRLRKLRAGEYDAIVLAAAGVRRLGIAATHMVPFDPADIVPAAAQGMLAVETRANDRGLAAILRSVLNDQSSEIEATAERTFLAAIGGGCSLPAGVHAHIDAGAMTVHAALAPIDGSTVIRASRSGTATIESAREIGCALAAEIRTNGGAAIVAALAPEAARLHGRLLILPRTQERPSSIAPALRERGAEVLEFTASTAPLNGRAPDLIVVPSSGAVAVLAEYLGALHARGERPRIAAMGPASSASAAAAGFPPDVVSPCADVETFVATIARYLSELE